MQAEFVLESQKKLWVVYDLFRRSRKRANLNDKKRKKPQEDA